MNKSFHDKLKEILSQHQEYILEDSSLNGLLLMKHAQDFYEPLLSILMKYELTKEKFFTTINGYKVFQRDMFIDYVLHKNFLANSYTKYKNHIGLEVKDNDYFLHTNFLGKNKNIVLSFPFKDCILEGGQTKDDQKTREIFFNEVLAPDEIDRLLDPKVLTKFQKITSSGEATPDHFTRDETGTITDNLLIKGNNLLALHTLAPLYRGKVKLIYIDPPYNTQTDANTFAYNNNFNHSTWLTFMKNRLEVAKELLRDDGFISMDIDHYELFYLGVLADEIFGRENRVGIISVITNRAGRHNDFFATAHENKLIYAKNINNVIIKDFDLTEERLKDFNQEDHIGKYKLTSLKRTGDHSTKEDRPGLYFPIYYDEITNEITTTKKENYVEIYPASTDNTDRCWRWGKEKIEREWRDNLVVKKNDTGYTIYVKDRLTDDRGEKPKTFWDKKEYAGANGTAEIKKLLGEKVFTYPKSMHLVKDTIKILAEDDSIILDFFGGSGTTAHAVMELNKQDGGNRKFILIEQMDYIENITKKRIQKAIEVYDFDENFIYMELKKYNQLFVDMINNATTEEELIKLQDTIFTESFYDYKIEKEKLEETKDGFKALDTMSKKKILLDMLDKNQLYTNLDMLEDEFAKCDKEEIKLNIDFFGKKYDENDR